MSYPFHLSDDGPPPEMQEKIEKFMKAEADHMISWRRTITGPWSALFCTCSNPFIRVPGKPIYIGCHVHGEYMVTYTGETI